MITILIMTASPQATYWRTPSSHRRLPGPRFQKGQGVRTHIRDAEGKGKSKGTVWGEVAEILICQQSGLFAYDITLRDGTTQTKIPDDWISPDMDRQNCQSFKGEFPEPRPALEMQDCPYQSCDENVDISGAKGPQLKMKERVHTHYFNAEGKKSKRPEWGRVTKILANRRNEFRYNIMFEGRCRERNKDHTTEAKCTAVGLPEDWKEHRGRRKPWLAGTGYEQNSTYSRSKDGKTTSYTGPSGLPQSEIPRCCKWIGKGKQMQIPEEWIVDVLSIFEWEMAALQHKEFGFAPESMVLGLNDKVRTKTWSTHKVYKTCRECRGSNRRSHCRVCNGTGRKAY